MTAEASTVVLSEISLNIAPENISGFTIESHPSIPTAITREVSQKLRPGINPKLALVSPPELAFYT